MTRPDGVRSLLRDSAYLRVWLIGACVGIARWLELLVVGVFAIEVTVLAAGGLGVRGNRLPCGPCQSKSA